MRGVRARLREWLSSLAWPEPDADDVVMAVSEACTNAVEHAYRTGDPGQVAVSCRSAEAGEGKRQAVVVVRDWGRWRPAQGDRRFRGHGLSLMRGCVQTVRLDHGDLGTVVTLASFAVPS
jgi:anti-sigma regulatory factor (Ser/Thr protein kinase)